MALTHVKKDIFKKANKLTFEITVYFSDQNHV